MPGPSKPTAFELRARRAQLYLTAAANEPMNIKIAAGVAAAAVLAAVFFGMGHSSQKTASVLPEAGCKNQTWPYIDQTCADAMKLAAEKQKPAPPRTVRVVSPEGSATANVALAPSQEAKLEPAAPKAAPSVISKADAATPAASLAGDKPVPAQTVAATGNIGSDKDAFVPATAIATPAATTAAVDTATPVESAVEVRGPVQVTARPAERIKSAATLRSSDTPKRSKTALTQPEQLARDDDDDADPNTTVVQSRMVTLSDGRQVIERRVYRNVRPDPAYRASRGGSSATYTRTLDDD